MKAGCMVPLTLNAADMTALVSYVSSLGGTSVASATTPSATTPTAATPTGEGPAPSVPTEAKPGAPSAPSKAATATPEPSAFTGNKSTETVPGEKIYQSDGCAACHGEGGTGTQRGPALVDVGRKL